MISSVQSWFRPAVAALAGGMALPAVSARADAEGAIAPASPSASLQEPVSDRAFPSESCLASTICSLKQRVRWRTPAWRPEFCLRIARAVLSSAARHDMPPSLILAIMLNESDLNEKAFRVSLRGGVVYAKDSGLMGIRCVVDRAGGCVNGNVRGLAWSKLMDPFTNIELGARQLDHWRTAGVARATTTGKPRYVRCRHATHAYWAHYNHGPLYIDSGRARHYPHRIAVLYYALARAMNLESPELTRSHAITIRDPGRRRRTSDRPVEARYRKLCAHIRESGGSCTNVASL